METQQWCRRLAIALALTSAAVQEVAAQFVYGSFAAADFDETAANRIDLNDAAALSGARINLSPFSGSSAGSAFYGTPQVVMGGFETQFTFSITNKANGADGMAFVLHNAAGGRDALGGPGSGLGYGGNATISNSLIVEIDTYSGLPDPVFAGGESTGLQAQISIHRNGIADDSLGLIGAASVGANTIVVGGGLDGSATDVSNGLTHSMLIRYVVNPGADNDLLQVYYNDGTVTPTSLVLSLSATAANGLEGVFAGAQSGGASFVGFTAGTGGSFESHEIVNWSFTPVPEPGPICLLALLAPAAMYWRKRKARVPGRQVA